MKAKIKNEQPTDSIPVWPKFKHNTLYKYTYKCGGIAVGVMKEMWMDNRSGLYFIPLVAHNQDDYIWCYDFNTQQPDSVMGTFELFKDSIVISN